MFYKFWNDAVNERNEYVPIEVHWSCRCQAEMLKWKEQTIANTSEEQFRGEFECEFIGSTSTLISSAKLKCLTYDQPIVENEEGLRVFHKPKRVTNMW